MKFKQLKWRDNITDSGKALNMFQQLSDVKELDLSYQISNSKKFGDKPVKNKFFLWINNRTRIECTTFKEAKEKAQNHFETSVLKTFFKK